jgi:outer membrane receptor protein involved in Fe transport
MRIAASFAVAFVVVVGAGARQARAQRAAEPRTLRAETLEVVEQGADDGAPPAEAPATAFAIHVPLERAQEEARSLADVLETIPSLHVRRLGGLGAYATLSIRGSTASQVAVLVDGVPIAPSSDGAVSLDDLSVDAFEAVDVYRGVAPLSLGGGFAIGGVVDLRTTAARAPMRAAVTAGSFGTFRLGLAAPARIGSFRVHARTSLLTSRGDFDFLDDRGTRQNPDDDAVVPRENADFTRVDAGARATTRFGSAARLDLAVAGSAREGGVPGLGTFQAREARSRTLRTLATAALSGPLGAAGTGGLRVAARADATGFRDRGNEVGLGPQDRSDRTLYGAVTTPVTLSLAGGIGELVAEASMEEVRAEDPVAVVPEPGPITRRRAGLGASFERAAGPVTLRAAGSFAIAADGHEVAQTAIGSVAASGNPPLRGEPGAGVGVRLDPAPWLSLRSNAMVAVRAPTFEELFGNSGSVQGSPDLDPERAVGVDLGATASGPHGRATVAAYWQEVRDLITFVQTSQRTARAANTGRARLRGLEAEASARPWPWLGGRVGVGLLDAENLADIPSQRGKRVPGRPAFDLAAGVETTLDLVTLGADVDLVAGNFLDPANLQEVPARAYVGAVARLSPLPGVTLVVSARNLLDHRVADVTLHPPPRGGRREIAQPVSDYGGFPLPGRTLLFTLRWTQTQEESP